MPPGQPDHRLGRRRVPTRITCTVYEHAPHSVRTPTTGQTTHDPVCTDYTTGRGHTAVSGFALQLNARLAVVVLRNSATLTVPSRQLQLTTQANVSIVLYGLRPDRRWSPGSVATGYLCSPQHDRHPSLSPISTKLLVTHCVTALEFCWRMASSVYKYSSCRSTVYTACVMLLADSTRRERWISQRQRWWL